MAEDKKTSKLKGSTRSVLSWVKPCEQPKTLETLKNLSVEDLNKVISVCDMLKAEAQKTIDAQAEIELNKAKEEQAKLAERIAQLEAAVAAKKK